MSNPSDNVHQLLQPNTRGIREHLELLFSRPRREYPGGQTHIAWSGINGSDIGWDGQTFPITEDGLNRATAEAVKRNLENRNVYVQPNPCDPNTSPFGRAKDKDVEIAYFQYADLDRPESIEILRQTLPLNYTNAVTTGRIPNPRVHAYWELDEPIRNLTAWREQQRALAVYFKSDAVINPSRLMRLAGTVNYPMPKKITLGYKIEPVTLRTVYDDDRDPVSSEAMFHAYPWSRGATGNNQAADSENGRPQSQSDRFGTWRDPMEFVRNIAAGINLHNNARDLAAHLVNAGYRDWLIRDYLDRLLRPVSDGGTLGQIEELIRSARQKFNTSEPSQEEEEDFNAPPPPPPEPEPLNAEPVGVLNPGVRRPREWLVPYRMMRRHITMTTAAPGVGKSTLAVEEAVSMVTGIDFLGFGITEKLRVAIINNEETRDELERRVEATCQHFGIPFEAIAGRLFLYSGVDNPKLVLVRADRKSGLVIPTEQLGQLRALIKTQQLDVVILDPFVQLHYVEESSNEQISHALQQLRGLGNDTHPAAIHVIHHNRKPAAGNSHQAGDLSAARGASSMGGEAHFFFTLADMGQEEAGQLNISEDDRINYLRLDDAKRKMAPAQGARWFERHGEIMPYGLMGEEIGILIPLDRAELNNATISTTTATAILQLIEDAWTNGAPYSEHHQSNGRFVITVMMREFRLTKPTAKALLKDWLENGVVITDTRNGHTKLQGLRVLKWPG